MTHGPTHNIGRGGFILMALLPLANNRPGGSPSRWFWRRCHLLEHRFGFFPRYVPPEYLVKVFPKIAFRHFLSNPQRSGSLQSAFISAD